MKNLAGTDEAGAADAVQDAGDAGQAEAMEMTGEAGAGLVKVTMNGKSDMRKIKIDPKIVDPAEREMLEDLILAATSRCRDKDRGRDGRGNAEGDRRHGASTRDEAAFLVARGQWVLSRCVAAA